MAPAAGGKTLTRSGDLGRSFDHVPWISGLLALSERLSAADDLEDVATSGAAWFRDVLGSDAAVAFARPDGSGRLRVVWSVGSFPFLAETAARRRLAERRIAFGSLQPVRIEIGPEGQSLAFLPLAARGRGVGLVEVLADGSRIEEAWDVLEVGTSQIGVAFDSISRSERLRQEVETLERASSLGASLVGASSVEDAVRSAVGFVSERFRVPVAGWCGIGREHGFVDARGIGGRGRRDLGSGMSTIPRWGTLDLAEREALKVRFQELARVRRVSALDVGDAVLLVGRTEGDVDGSLEMVGSLLAEVLRVIDTAALANLRNERLDLGIAWTAHELKGPLLGIRAALELLLRRRPDPSERRVLSTSLNELDQLAGSAEAILTWAVGAAPLEREETDLVRIVDEVAEAVRLETGGEDRIVVTGDEHAIARCDPTHLRTVVANLIRNALAYSFRGTKVEVEVGQVGDAVQLSVRDEGPEIPTEEAQVIFDPFARGTNADSVRNGSGLGLFIARQVVEAHGGRIWVESERGTTAFVVRLPIDGRELRRFAS
jgi:signal transduction histidine kinase